MGGSTGGIPTPGFNYDGRGGNSASDLFGATPGGDLLGYGPNRGGAFGLTGTPPSLPSYVGLTNPDGTPYKAPTAAQVGTPAGYTAQGYNATQLGNPSLASLDRSGLQSYTDFATGTGDSPWAQASLNQEALGTQGQRDQLASQTAGAVQQGTDRLAMGGGISGGSAERLATAGATGGLLARQGLEKGSLDRQAGIRTQDAAARQGFLQGLPGQDLAAAGFDQRNSDIVNRFSETNALAQNQAAGSNAAAANTAAASNAGAQNQAAQFNANATNAQNQNNMGTAETEAQRRSNFDQQNYQTQAGIYGGANLAAATAAQGAGKKGSSFVCSELRARGRMTLRESKEMTDFMLRGLPQRADFFAWYFQNGDRLIKMAKLVGVDWDDVKRATVADVLKLIHQGKEVEAQNAYVAAVARLNMHLGLPMGPMDHSIRKPGRVKSLLALPRVFLLPQTWAWMNAQLEFRLTRTLKKLRRKVA